ncbi:acetyl-CoA carboxylase biotin carboxylase subunit family protein [Streptomyces sp. NPDC057545]|uniref:ATP-grasp domain-containing protein n=1 Tax=Streptomyces sp. NPDC057545 TaxID=3346164 RepID=UPI00369581CB
MKPLVVVYDEGAAQPSEIAAGLADVAPLITVIAPSEHARTRQPLLAQFGRTVDATSVDDAVRELAAEQPAGIVTFSERALRLTTVLAERLGLPFHSRRTTTLLTDKFEQRTALRDAGVHSIRFHRIAEPGEWPAALAAVGLPAVLKPAHGGSSRNTYLVQDEETGRRLAERLLAEGCPGFEEGGALVLEEYLVGRPSGPFGDYVSVESVAEDGGVRHLAITGKMPVLAPFRESGDFWPAALDAADREAVYELTTRALHAVGVRSGLAHTEVKMTAEGPRIIEINGRLGGDINAMAVFVMGLSLTETAGRVALGLPVTLPAMPEDKVYFHVFHSGPTVPCDLVAFEGADLLRKLPGVSVYRSHVRPGTSFPGGTNTQELDVAMGTVADHAELVAKVDEMARCLQFHVTFPGDGTVHILNGTELGRL